MLAQPLLIDGQWIEPDASSVTFQAANPATGDDWPEHYVLSDLAQLQTVLAAGQRAARELARHPAGARAAFLERYAELIEAHAEELAVQAERETGHPAGPRYLAAEIPRTLLQLRDAARCARDENWTQPVIDTALNLRSRLESLGKPVLVFGPNNFPFAYNGICGGDFAAAVATGHPVIAKAHPAHPGTTLQLGRLAARAVQECGLPPATVQLFYHCSPADGLALAGDPRLGAIGFTGSAAAGRAIKAAADAAGIPAYFEMSGVNPVGILPAAMAERPAEIAAAYCDSCHQGVGQFCTNPGLVLVVAGPGLDTFIAAATARFAALEPGPMLTAQLPRHLAGAVRTLVKAGAQILAQSKPAESADFRPRATLLRVDGARFLADPAGFQEEMFGPASLLVVAGDVVELRTIFAHLNASLTGSLYTARDGSDDALYSDLVPLLTPRIGRLLNDKMPTGVAVSPAMMHGGPFPAGGHPGFTAVGMPASLRRFGALRCYDSVRPHRLPPALRDHNPNPALWRCIDGAWTRGDVETAR